MIQIILLVLGFILLIIHQYIYPISNNTQYIIFFVGILFLGVPHGAADLLVAIQNEGVKKFSKLKFFVVYISRLILFALILYLLPIVGILLFIIFAAYHFGETDLFKFKTNTITGKLFTASYGLVILSIILINHFEEAKPIFLLFEAGKANLNILNFVDAHRLLIMSLCCIVFFIATFVYFLFNNNFNQKDKGVFLIYFACLVLLLFNMPMILGFTFYFISWHSLLSIKNIINYLKTDNKIKAIITQIIFYSSIAIVGIIIFGYSAFLYANNNAMAGYIFLGLAVLTAPHMEVMGKMYTRIRHIKGL